MYFAKQSQRDSPKLSLCPLFTWNQAFQAIQAPNQTLISWEEGLNKDHLTIEALKLRHESD